MLTHLKQRIKDKLAVRELRYSSADDPLGRLLIIDEEELNLQAIEALERIMRREAIHSVGKRVVKFMVRL